MKIRHEASSSSAETKWAWSSARTCVPWRRDGGAHLEQQPLVGLRQLHTNVYIQESGGLGAFT